MRAARRLLEGYRGARVLGELLHVEADRAWAVHVELTADVVDEGPVPRVSRWYLRMGERYPWGDIEIYPSKEDGLTRTFHHQDYNGTGDAERPWREGDLCVRSPGFAIGRRGDDPDPKGQPDRVLWYIDRSLEWLRRASRGELVADGDDFELPQWRSRVETVGFIEDPSSFRTWQGVDDRCGTVDLVPLKSSGSFAARRFLAASDKPILTPAWGTYVSEATDTVLAGWIRLPSVPVMAPYQAPMTWGEILEVIFALGVDANALLEAALRPLRNGNRHLLLIGFPIPRRFGDPPSLMHWQPLFLPELGFGGTQRGGFRPTPKALWQHDLSFALAKGKALTWLTGSNWSLDSLATRGRLAEKLRSRRVLLVGGGALGSAIAELLVRGGVTELIVVDNDAASAGNLSRHTLALPDVGARKALALAARLNSLSPHARARGIVGSYPDLPQTDLEETDRCEIVIDCSGSDDVIAALASRRRLAEGFFLSASMGRGAVRFYLSHATGDCFPAPAFWEALAPWLERDRAEVTSDYLWEGPGCWHPVFPATAVDAWRCAVVAVDHLQRCLGLEGSGVAGGEVALTVVSGREAFAGVPASTGAAASA